MLDQTWVSYDVELIGAFHWWFAGTPIVGQLGGGP